jgi:ACS family glucarate transporter-like MFS transporter
MSSAAGSRVFPIRWRIFSFLFGFGFLAYVQSKTITVAAEQMMPVLHLTQLQIGWLEDAFVWGYAIFQLPGGVFGQRLGARRTFVIIGLTAFLATIATPTLPDLFTGQPLFVALLLAQLLLGFSQGAIFPVSAGVFEAWFPPNRWSFVQGLQTMGLQLGAALTPPLIVLLTQNLGWQHALLWASLPALGLIALWAWYGRNTPREHPAVTERELAEIGNQPQVDSSISLRQLLRLLKDRNVVLLFVSYMCMNYTFYLLSNWVFLYLIEERHFSSLESGWLAVAPPLTAALGAGAGGLITAFSRSAGAISGDTGLCRWWPCPPPRRCCCAPSTHPIPTWRWRRSRSAIGAVELTEGAYWGSAMTVGRGDTMAVCGFMNTGGNLGGIIALPIVGYFAEQHAWHTAFFIGVGFAIVSALAWLGIEVV